MSLQDAERLLKRCVDGLKTVERSRQDALSQMLAITDTLESLERCQHELEAQAATIRSCLAQAKRRARPGLSACPDDILLCIFEQLCMIFEARWDPDGDNVYDEIRAVGPFCVAAVCSQWRTLALRCSRLWRYVSLPLPSAHVLLFPFQKSLIQLALVRSKSYSIDALAQEDWSDNERHPNFSDVAWFISIISQHTERWGRVEIWGCRRHDLRSFYIPTPSLTHLLLEGFYIAVADPLPNDFLPFAPQLRGLALIRLDLVCSDVHPGFPSLVSLVLGGNDLPWEHIRRFLTLARRTLQTASIAPSRHPMEHPTIPLLALPKLSSLALTSRRAFATPWSWNVEVPNLTSFRLDGAHLCDEMLPLLHQIAPTVTHLTLGSDDYSDSVYLLEHLEEITHLSLGTVYGRDNYLVDDNVFAELATSDPPVWPRLTRIELGPYGELNSSFGEGLIRLKGSRSLLNFDTDEDVGILREVIIRDQFTSPSLKAVMTRVMAAFDSIKSPVPPPC
ncbi:hypothetical protein AURDEDRAFT_123818 [Auricularia subglabra TFB-10046 SS5]|nr:hypothetical protein AURDEDRAFT_123818 [Auricularia subglabra TFB-10046 SS5]